MLRFNILKVKQSQKMKFKCQKTIPCPFTRTKRQHFATFVAKCFLDWLDKAWNVTVISVFYMCFWKMFFLSICNFYQLEKLVEFSFVLAVFECPFLIQQMIILTCCLQNFWDIIQLYSITDVATKSTYGKWGYFLSLKSHFEYYSTEDKQKLHFYWQSGGKSKISLRRGWMVEETKFLFFSLSNRILQFLRIQLKFPSKKLEIFQPIG